MLSKDLTIGIALMGAGCLLVVGTALVCTLERRRHNRLMRAQMAVGRVATIYHRPQLSVDGNNYSHVPPPMTSLRRSVHMPYGVVSGNWAFISSKESFNDGPVMTEHQVINAVVDHSKRKQSIGQALYGHSSQVPKTRRQKKIEKAIPLTSLPRSPLSAITEFTDSTSSQPSPTTGLVELPTQTTPKETTERTKDVDRAIHPPSLQWPLPVAKKSSQDLLSMNETSVAVRKSVLMRMMTPGPAREAAPASLGPRSISMTSTVTIAPKESLPPLPPLNPKRQSNHRESRLRLSTLSIDTVDSSILGTGMESPFKMSRDRRSTDRLNPQINLLSPGLQDFEPSKDSCEPSAVTFGILPAKRTIHGYCRGKQSAGSICVSIGTTSLRKPAGPEGHSDVNNKVISQSVNTIAARSHTTSWNQPAHFADTLTQPGFAPLGPVAVSGPSLSNRNLSTRHSMWEKFTPVEGQVPNPLSGRIVYSEQKKTAQAFMPLRPASVASSNPFQWNKNSETSRMRLSMIGSLGSNARGHKRQNCIRISNLPLPEATRGIGRLPQMTEEDEQEMESSMTGAAKIPGLDLLETGEQASKARASLVDIKSSPSPFKNPPILEPTGQSTRSASIRSSAYSSCGFPRPDSDVFTFTHSDSTTSNIFASSPSPGQWPLPVIPGKLILFDSSPPTRKDVENGSVINSPILPSPALTSATLFPRKSGIQGPRRLPTSSRASRTTSPSPLASRRGQKRSGDDLRRSVMMLRRMGSEGNLLEQNTRTYRNAGDESSSSSDTPITVDSTISSVPSSALAVTSLSTLKIGHLGLEKTRSAIPTSTAMGTTRSKTNMAISPSVMSMAGASIWEDISVRGDSPEPELPIRSNFHPDSESFENFIGQNCTRVSEKIRERTLTSPQGKGLGLTVGNAILGTPRSLYDRDGFLKEY